MRHEGPFNSTICYVNFKKYTYHLILLYTTHKKTQLLLFFYLIICTVKHYVDLFETFFIMSEHPPWLETSLFTLFISIYVIFRKNNIAKTSKTRANMKMLVNEMSLDGFKVSFFILFLLSFDLYSKRIIILSKYDHNTNILDDCTIFILI